MLAEETRPLLLHRNIPPNSDMLDTAETGSCDNEDFSSPAPGSQSSLPFLQRLQSVSILMSLLLSPVSIILVSIWASSLGGVSWKEGEASRVFNWHPIMMVTAYAFMNAGALMFRVSGTSSYQSSVGSAPMKRGIAKAAHASTWSLSFVFGIVGILAVFKSHNDKISGYIANLYSLHSWVGVMVLTVYTLQFLFGVLAFGGLLSGRSRLRNPVMMELHKYTGTYIHFLVTATMLLGIQEKEGFVSCKYAVDSADLMPFLNYAKIPYACKISHGLGLVILFMGMFTSFGLARFPVL
jgi:cytochrome b-561